MSSGREGVCMRRPAALTTVALLSFFLLSALPGPAWSTAPGPNGKIAFMRGRHIVVSDPDGGSHQEQPHRRVHGRNCPTTREDRRPDRLHRRS